MGELYGHWGYDLAKIGQCVLKYDLIDSELYQKNFYKLFSTDRKIIQDLFYKFLMMRLSTFPKIILCINCKFIFIRFLIITIRKIKIIL